MRFFQRTYNQFKKKTMKKQNSQQITDLSATFIEDSLKPKKRTQTTEKQNQQLTSGKPTGGQRRINGSLAIEKRLHLEVNGELPSNSRTALYNTSLQRQTSIGSLVSSQDEERISSRL